MLHARIEGQSVDLEFADLDIGLGSDDVSVRTAVANYFEVPADKLRNYTVERVGDEITVRPPATFG